MSNELSSDSILCDSILYRRQFILGPRQDPKFGNWPSASVGGNFAVQAHADLPLHQVDQDGIRITLLGYCIDPGAPEYNDREILVDLASHCQSAWEAPKRANNLGGRWTMIVWDGEDIIMFSDPCGMREAYFTNSGFEECWCASQPSRIAEANAIPVSAMAKSFMRSDYFQDHHEPWWPGVTTPYAEISQLQPNHLLDLRTRETRRFWPNEPLVSLDVEEASQSAAELLRRLLRAASHRFPLALPITSGMDSRMILAATRDIKGIWHYTALRKGLTRRSGDIRIPARLLRKLGRTHNVIKCPESMSGSFARIYRQNTTPAHDEAGAIAEGLFAAYPPERVSLSGHCSEIGRDTYAVTHKPVPSSSQLAALIGMNGNAYALEQFETWIEQTRPVAEAFDYRLWDIFFWEQEYGRWSANAQSQWDLVHERFTPFNHRELLRTMLRVNPMFRQPPDYSHHRRIIEILWPELLSEPFNPPPERSYVRRLLSGAKRITKRLLR